MTNTRAEGADRPGPPLSDRVRLSGPTDLIAIVPYLLGFHPTDSVVVLAVRGKRPVFTIRLDLLPTGAPAGELRDLVEPVPQLLRQNRASGALIVAYGPADRATPAVAAVRAALRPTGLDVIEALRVSDGRYWSYLCANRDCCPAAGTPFDMSSSAAAAAATVAGMVALPDRAALVRQVGPADEPTRRAMREATRRADVRMWSLVEEAGGPGVYDDEPDDEERWAAAADAVLAAGRRAVARGLATHADGGRLSDDEAAWLCLLISLIPVRDHAWQQIIDNPGDVELHKGLWLDITSRAEDELVPAPGCLLAFCAWTEGHGALASAALERVLDLDPDYSMADLLLRGLSTGLHPAVLYGDPKRRVRSRLARPRRRRSSTRRERTPRG
jgi:hypothetical protein